MSVLRWQLLPTLGRALLRLAGLLGASGYADHYARDLGLPAEPAAAPTAAAQAGSGLSQAGGAAPPDMFRALQALLAGQRDGGGVVPLLAAQKAGCVRRSADLLAAYGLLAEAAASLSASLSLEAAQVGGKEWGGELWVWRLRARTCSCAAYDVRLQLQAASPSLCLLAACIATSGCSLTAQVCPSQASDLLQAAAHRIVRLLVRPTAPFSLMAVTSPAHRHLLLLNSCENQSACPLPDGLDLPFSCRCASAGRWPTWTACPGASRCRCAR